MFRKIVRDRSGGQHFYVALLGMQAQETRELLERVQAGFPSSTFERFRQNVDLQVEELADLMQISRRTLARRIKEGHLTSDESDRLLRVARVFGKVLALFEGDVDAARAWFWSPAAALGNQAPRDLSTTEVGAREVENLIGRLEHGVFS